MDHVEVMNGNAGEGGKGGHGHYLEVMMMIWMWSLSELERCRGIYCFIDSKIMSETGQQEILSKKASRKTKGVKLVHKFQKLEVKITTGNPNGIEGIKNLSYQTYKGTERKGTLYQIWFQSSRVN